tara:strand:- start:40 stop:282 length:243 start_codon:yes stop_codon:yes gene_type:complete
MDGLNINLNLMHNMYVGIEIANATNKTQIVGVTIRIGASTNIAYTDTAQTTPCVKMKTVNNALLKHVHVVTKHATPTSCV